MTTLFELNTNKYLQNLFLKFYHYPHLYFFLSQTFAKCNCTEVLVGP
jgi:hypothetical protein